jgi:hypothetical protein
VTWGSRQNRKTEEFLSISKRLIRSECQTIQGSQQSSQQVPLEDIDGRADWVNYWIPEGASQDILWISFGRADQVETLNDLREWTEIFRQRPQAFELAEQQCLEELHEAAMPLNLQEAEKICLPVWGPRLSIHLQ